MSTRDDLKLMLKIFGITLVALVMNLVIGTIIHEAGHTLMAMAFGIPFNELKFAWHRLGPGVTVPNYVSQESLVYFRYAGGLTAGTVFLICYVLYSIWQRHSYVQPRWWSKFRWWFGYILLECCGCELLLSYLEGARFEDYITGKLPSLPQLLIAFIATFLIHLLLTIVLVRKRIPKIA